MASISIDDNGYSYDSLEKKYNDFFAPGFEIYIDGTNIIQNQIAVTKVEVDTTTDHQADSLQFTVVHLFDPVKRQFKAEKSYFEVGKYVEVRMGYVDKLEAVFYGVITSVSFDYPVDDQPNIEVSAMDMSYIMMRGKKSRVWNKKTYDQIAKDIGGNYLSDLKVDAISGEQPFVVQQNMTDYHFLVHLARKNNFDFFIVGKTLYFRKKLKSTTPVLKLTWQKNILRFSAESNLSDQVSAVIVRGWNDETGEVITAESGQVKRLGSNSKTGSDIMKKLSGETKEILFENIASVDEAQHLADEELNRRSLDLVQGRGEILGIPEVRAGKYLQIEGVDKEYDQPLYIIQAKHKISSSGYRTSFSIRGNAI